MPLWIDNDRTDPPWNLAAEEHVLMGTDATAAMLWRNDRSVIIGRNQDLRREVDMDFAGRHGIRVVRRLSGGGAVFHDLGNVNFTYICHEKSGTELSFERFARPLKAALLSMGVRAELSGRNDLLVDGLKVSGCAHTRVGGRALYHGTLLFSADLASMSGALRVGADKYAGRGVKSVASRVANLNRWLEPGLTPEAFMSELRVGLLRELIKTDDFIKTVYSEDEVTRIDRLRGMKYAAMSWTDGADESMTCLGTARDTGGGVQVWAVVSDGRLERVRLTGDFMSIEPVITIERALTGVAYEPEAVKAALLDAPVEQALCGISREHLFGAIF